MNHLNQCGNCLDDERKARYRDFNPQIWSLLVSWEEVDQSAVGQPLCESCYRDLREMLIDRSREMEMALTTGIPFEVRNRVGAKAEPVATKAALAKSVSKGAANKAPIAAQAKKKAKPVAAAKTAAAKKKAKETATAKKKKSLRAAG